MYITECCGVIDGIDGLAQVIQLRASDVCCIEKHDADDLFELLEKRGVSVDEHVSCTFLCRFFRNAVCFGDDSIDVTLGILVLGFEFVLLEVDGYQLPENTVDSVISDAFVEAACSKQTLFVIIGAGSAEESQSSADLLEEVAALHLPINYDNTNVSPNEFIALA